MSCPKAVKVPSADECHIVGTTRNVLSAGGGLEVATKHVAFGEYREPELVLLGVSISLARKNALFGDSKSKRPWDPRSII